ncbi:MAG: proton-conducting transporter membrane subunit, partial [Deltaproteobacteria bacterium]
LLLPLALLCLAAMIKSAQLPFQKWLLGAMVAPTPVSALLHASTMVNAGAYLVLRFSPAITGGRVGVALAMLGAVSFAATAALAIGKRNAKKILAFSTISNLGLIFACAGLASPEAAAIGFALLLQHAVSKGLLFLCIGNFEQHLERRDLETMRGLAIALPVTGIIAIIAILALILPPFGMLLGKWLLLESGAANLTFFILLVVGNGCTLLYWMRLTGTLITGAAGVPVLRESKIGFIHIPQIILCLAVFVLSALAPQLFFWSGQAMASLWEKAGIVAAGLTAGPVRASSFPFLPLLLVALVFAIWALAAVRAALRTGPVAPYLAGANASEEGASFVGPMNHFVQSQLGNYYLTGTFGNRLGFWCNTAAWLLLALLFGSVL